MNKYLLAACLILATICILSIRTCTSEVASRAVIENNAKAKDDTLTQYKLKSGQQAATIQAQDGTLAELKATDAAIIKDREQKLNLKASELEGAQDANVQLQLSFADTLRQIHRGDTIAVANHHDSFNSFHETIIDDTAHGQQIIYVTDTPTVPLHLTEHLQHKPLLKEIFHPFQPPVHYITAYSDNPSAKITGLESVLIVKEKPKTIRTIEAIAAGVLGGLLLHNFIH